MQDQEWYDEKNFAAEPGYYALQLRVPDSNEKNWHEQQELLVQEGESFKPAPAAVAATAFLLHLKKTGSDLLQNDWSRCLEEAAYGGRVVLTVFEDRMHVDGNWDAIRNDDLWLAAARKF